MPITEARRAYLRKYQNVWIQERRRQWIAENGPCQLCGSTVDLEVDHKDACDKRFNVASLWSLALSNPKRVRELAKCWVLCSRCHKQKRLDNADVEFDHPKGTLNPRAKLNEGQVIWIRNQYATGKVTQQWLADQLNLTRVAIQYVISRKTWKHV